MQITNVQLWNLKGTLARKEHAFASASHTSLRNASPNNDALEDESIECFKDWHPQKSFEIRVRNSGLRGGWGCVCVCKPFLSFCLCCHGVEATTRFLHTAFCQDPPLTVTLIATIHSPSCSYGSLRNANQIVSTHCLKPSDNVPLFLG